MHALPKQQMDSQYRAACGRDALDVLCLLLTESEGRSQIEPHKLGSLLRLIQDTL